MTNNTDIQILTSLTDLTEKEAGEAINAAISAFNTFPYKKDRPEPKSPDSNLPPSQSNPSSS